MQTHKNFPLSRLYAFLLGCLLAAAATAANPAFEAGVAASKRGDYQEAVEHFREAREQGVDTPVLYHNLGVAYYKLGRYVEAREAFERVTESPKMRALAFYNLGLVAQKTGDDAATREWFEKAHDTARGRKLRRLAAVQLGLEEDVVSPYTLYLEGFAGHDSNPRLTDEEVVDGGDESDAVFGALAVGQRLLAGDWENGATAIGVAYVDFHPDLEDQDIGAFMGGFAAHHSPGRWRHRYELTVNRIRLGGDTLQTGVRLGLHSKRRLGENLTAGLRLRGEDIEGEDGFGYLSGRRYEARLRLRDRRGPTRWGLHYEFEYNDRDNLGASTDTGIDFFSVSPTRHEIGYEIERRLGGDWTGEARIAYRISEYDEPEVRAGEEFEEREDDRIELGLDLSHPLGGDWTGRIETTYWDNSSDCGDGACDRFEYDRLQTLISIGRSF